MTSIFIAYIGERKKKQMKRHVQAEIACRKEGVMKECEN